MSDENNGGRWGSWLNGPAGRTPRRIVAGVGVGAFGVAVYYGTKPKVDAVPLPLKDKNDGGGGGGEAVDGLKSFDDAGLHKNIISFFENPAVQAATLVSIVALGVAWLALRRGSRQTAHA